MILTSTQKELITSIQQRLRHGDIKLIAGKTGFSREYVGRALSINHTEFHEDIVKTAVDILNKREQDNQKLLEKLIS